MAEQASKPRKRTSKKAAVTSLPAIKGFDRDLTCRGFQFEPGKTYEQSGTIRACSNGFHSCPVDDDTPPHAVFEYYAPGLSRYFEVTASGATDRDGNKIASASVTIGVELTMCELMRRVADWCVRKAKGAASNSGDCGAASNSGTRGAASNSGNGGAASNSGYYGAASNSGNGGAAMSHAYGSKVMCEGDGQALYCSEFNDNMELVSNACGITGRDGIEAGVWYACRDGKLVQA
jgi:hypothetical protein